jgi:hypothetical protein
MERLLTIVKMTMTSNLNYNRFCSVDFDYSLPFKQNSLSETNKNSSKDNHIQEVDFSSLFESFKDESFDNKMNLNLYGVKKRKQRVLYPRILKTDVRRQYAEMFANVWNSTDFRLINGFMDMYCARTNDNKRTANDPENITTTKMNGFEQFSKYLYIHLMLAPDTILRVTNVDLCLDSQNNSTDKIKCQLQIQGTEIYEAPEMIHRLYLSQSFPLTATSDNTNTTNNTIKLQQTVTDESRVNYFVNAIENLTKRTLKLRREPAPYFRNGQLNLFLDNTHAVS